MIDTTKLNTEELGNIIVDVQNETGFWFDVDDMVAIMQHTIRKADLNGKDEEYITPEEYQQLAEEFIGARPVENKEDETNGKNS